MKVIGITGGVGCGKSTVLSILKKHLNAYVIMADDVAKELYKPGSDIMKFIEKELGKECVGKDGGADRKAVARIIFSDDTKRKRLEDVVHPEVKKRIIEEIRKLKSDGMCDWVFVEAALLLEENYDEFCDEVWYVTADEAVRRSRLRADRGYSDEKIDAIMKTQLSGDEYAKRCSRLIDNSGSVQDTENMIVKMLHGIMLNG